MTQAESKTNDHEQTVELISHHVADGVFFHVPESLPRGRHELSREQVLAAHHERMMIAATELLAEHGASAVGVREICSRAAASRGAFYECFTDKNDCIFQAYERFISVIEDRLSRVQSAAEAGRTAISTIVSEYLRILEEDLVTARAFQVEMDGFGFEARQRRRKSLEGVARLIHDQQEPGIADEESLRRYLVAVYGIRQAAADALDSQSSADLAGLADQCVPWLTRLLR